MTADMVLAGFQASTAFAEGDEKLRSKVKEQVLAAIEKLQMKDLIDFAEAASPNENSTVGELRTQAKETVEEVFKSLNYNDVTTWFLDGGQVLYLTGGMSWGDGATDSFDCFQRFSNLPSQVLNLLQAVKKS